jgi:hypothetical protein
VIGLNVDILRGAFLNWRHFTSEVNLIGDRIKAGELATQVWTPELLNTVDKDFKLAYTEAKQEIQLRKRFEREILKLGPHVDLASNYLRAIRSAEAMDWGNIIHVMAEFAEIAWPASLMGPQLVNSPERSVYELELRTSITASFEDSETPLKLAMRQREGIWAADIHWPHLTKNLTSHGFARRAFQLAIENLPFSDESWSAVMARPEGARGSVIIYGRVNPITGEMASRYRWRAFCSPPAYVTSLDELEWIEFC